MIHLLTFPFTFPMLTRKFCIPFILVLVLSRAGLPSHRQQLIAHTFHVSKHVGFPGSPEQADS